MSDAKTGQVYEELLRVRMNDYKTLGKFIGLAEFAEEQRAMPAKQVRESLIRILHEYREAQL